MEKKNDSIARLESQLRELSTKIDELKVQANLAKAEARDEYERQLKILHEKQAVAKKKLDELTEAGEEVWDELKFGMDNALNDMKEAVKHAREKLKS